METKKCPFCAEEIKVDAIKCKHCWSFLAEEKKNNNKEDNIDVFEEYEKYLILNFHWKYTILKGDKDSKSLILSMEYKNFSWFIFFVLLFLWVIPWIIYALITLQKSRKNIEIKFNDRWEVISASMNKDSLMKRYNEQKFWIEPVTDVKRKSFKLN